jgi:hypothetical protein
MNPNDTPTSPEPPIPASPEDDPRLQAIEALEARVVDPNPGPLDLDKLGAKPVVTPAPLPNVPAPDPVVQPVPVKPRLETTALQAPITPAPEKPIAPPQVPIQEVKKVEEKPKVPKTPAAEMAEELANAPATRPPFQFFLHQKASRQQIYIAVAIIGVIILGVLAYLGLRALQQ